MGALVMYKSNLVYITIQFAALWCSVKLVTSLMSKYPSKQLGNLTSYVSRIPCACAKGQCGCCTGSLLQSFNQKACMNITYEPDDFAFTAAMSVNGKVLYKNRVSGKNPPPMCIRVPRIRIVRLCVRLSNVYFTGPNMHTCVDMEANWEDFTLFDVSFDCFRIGAAGIAIVPPEDGGGISTVVDEDDDDEYDEDYDDSARDLNGTLFNIKISDNNTSSNSQNIITRW